MIQKGCTVRGEMNRELEEIKGYVEEWICRIRQIPSEIEEVRVDRKSSYRDLVTQVDRTLENSFREHIKARYPEHEILGEESYQAGRSYADRHLWVIDPIDGTTNFVKQKDDYCCILSYFEEGICQLGYVYDFKSEILYSARRGEGVFQNGRRLIKPADRSLRDSLVSMDIRRLQETDSDLFNYLVKNAFSVRVIGSGGLDGMRVITGKLGAYVHVKGGVWDYSPFFLMAEELGLCFTDFDGKKPSHTSYSSFILANPSLHRELMEFRRDKNFSFQV